MVTIRSFDNYFSANIALTKLQDAGIDCYLMDEYTVTIDPLLTNAIGGIKIQVAERDAPAAMQLLAAFDKAYTDSVPCPHCGTPAIERVAKISASNYFTAILTWIFGRYAIAPEQVYRCGQCGYESQTLPPMANEAALHE
jgi:predicted RNA-binding Zn-ribbon protein involved in translation (DUF1610 family)